MSNSKRTPVQQYYCDLVFAAAVRIPSRRGTADEIAEYAIALAESECHPAHLVLGITTARASGYLRALEREGCVERVDSVANTRYGRDEPVYSARPGIRGMVPMAPVECSALPAPAVNETGVGSSASLADALLELGEILGEMGTKLIDLSKRIEKDRVS